MTPLYLDYNASTPADPRVVEAMLPWLERPGNAASSHTYGLQAHRAVEEAREQVATLLDADPAEVVFTSGATEANNLAILGTAARAGADAEIVVAAVEHPAVLEPAIKAGMKVRVLAVDGQGVVAVETLERALTNRTALVCVMGANNETGALQPIAEIGRICREREIPYHSDLAQLVGRLPPRWRSVDATTAAVSAHKMYGPQ